MPSRFSSRCACPDYWDKAPRFPSGPKRRFPRPALIAALALIGLLALALLTL